MEQGEELEEAQQIPLLSQVGSKLCLVEEQHQKLNTVWGVGVYFIKIIQPVTKQITKQLTITNHGREEPVPRIPTIYYPKCPISSQKYEATKKF